MLGRLMNDMLAAEGPLYPWGDTLPLLRSADLAIVNLECVISDRGQRWSRTPKVFHFRALPPALDSLEAAGIDVVGLANNHVLDYEEVALLDMLERLRLRSIASAGAGRDLAEATRPAVVTASGVRVAVLALTDNEPGWAAARDRPGTHYIPISTDKPVRQHMANCIDEARQRADFVVVSAHWGPNMVLRPPPHHRAFAHMVIDLGVDLFVGHSAHVFQGIEWHDGKPILYDAGDFVDDYAVDPVLRNDWALLFLATLGLAGNSSAPSAGASPSPPCLPFLSRSHPGEEGGAPSPLAPPSSPRWCVQRLELVPLLIRDFQVNRARGDERDGIVERATLLCAEMGTGLEWIDGRLITYPPHQRSPFG
ncbi:MAG: CapA family protein [Chloroflexi bacterium]|nr:CapA family protein [Chloroflexota bacterium]